MSNQNKNLWKSFGGKGFSAEYADYAIRASEDVNGTSLTLTVDSESDTVTQIGGKKISAKTAETDINGNSLELTISGDTVTAIGGKTVGGGADIPVEGEVGQVLTKTQDGFGWEDAPAPDKGTFTTVSANVRTAYGSYIDVPSMPLKYNATRGLFVLSGAFNVKSTFTASHQYDDDPTPGLVGWTELIYWDLPQSIDTSLIERSLILGFTSSDPVITRTLRLWVKSNDTHRLVLGTHVGDVASNYYNIPDITKIL